MNIKNIKELARKVNLSLWAKCRLVYAHLYKDVEDILIEEIKTRETHKLVSSYEQNKIHEEKIQQAAKLLRLIRYFAQREKYDK